VVSLLEAVAAAKQLTTETGTSWFCNKAQVHAGGRGKGGGVKLAKTQQVEEISVKLLECNWLRLKLLQKVKSGFSC
jgi:succinyl-CoA synthetase beta subunit